MKPHNGLKQMERYIGTKEVKAKPMKRQAYNDYRGWGLPDNENGSDEGYLVEYMNGEEPNHEAHEGYISWVHKDAFDKTYKPFGTHLDRVSLELYELKTKARALNIFLNSPGFDSLSISNQVLLNDQMTAMGAYIAILNERITLNT